MESIELKRLRVHPDSEDDFDQASCEKLLKHLIDIGKTTVGDVTNAVVPLDLFFVGNHSKHSFAANVLLPAPFDTLNSWHELLSSVHNHSHVQGLYVDISMIEPYEDLTVRSWPYADALWIFSSLRLETIEDLLAPLEPTEIIDFTVRNPDWDIEPPDLKHIGSTAYRAWWD